MYVHKKSLTEPAKFLDWRSHEFFDSAAPEEGDWAEQGHPGRPGGQLPARPNQLNCVDLRIKKKVSYKV
jgi:hypothetical protein